MPYNEKYTAKGEPGFNSLTFYFPMCLQPPPPKSWKGGDIQPPPLIVRGFFLIAHICYYVQVIFIRGRLAALKLI